MKKHIIYCLVLLLPLTLIGQSPKARPEYEKKIECLLFLNKIKQLQPESSPQGKYNYRQLFSEPLEVQLAAEVLAANKVDQNQLLDDFYNDKERFAPYNGLQITNIRPYHIELVKASVEESIFRVKVLKSINLLSADQNEFIDTLDLEYQLAYYNLDSTIKVISLQLNDPQGKYVTVEVPEKLMSRKNFDQTLLVDRKRRKLFETGRLVIGGIDENSRVKIKVPSRDYIGKFELVLNPRDLTEEGKYRGQYYKLKVRPRNWHLNLGLALSSSANNFALKNNTLQSNANSDIELQSLKVGFGSDFIRLKGFRLGLDLNFIINQLTTESAISNYSSNSESRDRDDDAYIRKVMLDNWQESNNISFQSLELGFHTEVRLFKAISWVSEFAYEQSLSISGTRKSSAIIDIHGFYQSYANITMINDPKYGYFTDARTSVEATSVLNNINLFSLGTGADIALTKQLHVRMLMHYQSMQSPFVLSSSIHPSEGQGDLKSLESFAQSPSAFQLYRLDISFKYYF